MPPPSRARKGAQPAEDKLAQQLKPSPGAIGKLVSTKDFHCVRARDYAVFYKVLTQLK
jgi:hypothetical protein